jgi:N-dimethylarginine dimethylaminohydrolase
MLVPHVRHVVARVQVRTAAVVSEEGATALDDEEWLTVGVGDRKSRTKIATSRIEQRLLLPSCR